MAKSKVSEPTDKLLPKLSLFFFDRRWLTLVLWVALLTFGIFSYTSFLKREGFPSINIPIVVIGGTTAQDAQAIDQTIAKPLSDIALKQDQVSTVTTTSQDNFLRAMVQYEESADPDTARQNLEKAVREAGIVPQGANISFSAPYFGATGGSSEKIDATVSLYDPSGEASLQELTAKAEQAVTYLNKQQASQVERYFVQNPYTEIANPATGQKQTVQQSFDRFATQDDNRPQFYNSIIIGVSSVNDADVIKLDDEIHHALENLQQQPAFSSYETAISASFAPSIEESISELQRVLLEGLIAVLIVGSIVIAVRASLITVISMLTVIAMTLGLLFAIGYTLNVITLFALILGLSLIVDDTIIMIEAIDAARRKHRKARAVIKEASQKVSRAMVAATFTACFSFAPLLFVTGVLGSFIRAIPLTIISSLLISLLVALVFIPLFARFILLGKKQLGKEGHVVELASGVEHKIAEFIGKPMIWSKGSRRKQFSVGFGALFISLAFIGAALFLFTKVTFNIFPSSKDSNTIAVAINYPADTTIAEAEAVSDRINDTVSSVLGENLENASYYGVADNRTATLNIDLIPYGKRDVTAPELAEQLNSQLSTITEASANAYQIDVGPPASAFTVNIAAENRDAAITVANDLVNFMEQVTLTRPSGEVARFTDVTVGNLDVFSRNDGEAVITVNAEFDGTDTTTLTTLAQTAINEEFDAANLQSYGLSDDAISYSLGQESENQDSFASLALAFPIVLVAIYILLAVQFRSLLQPLLIFMALPFSLFGVALGLYVTNNAISFFALLGFFALIGLSIKNTILLTDYGNQARRSGLGPIDAAVAAIAERFRPLIATSLTAIVSLIPLAITSPFWEGLAFTLIFGLASSTLLVILVFPYYYLAGEYLRRVGSSLYSKVRQNS